jgi:hypothetical protein
MQANRHPNAERGERVRNLHAQSAPLHGRGLPTSRQTNRNLSWYCLMAVALVWAAGCTYGWFNGFFS